MRAFIERAIVPRGMVRDPEASGWTFYSSALVNMTMFTLGLFAFNRIVDDFFDALFSPEPPVEQWREEMAESESAEITEI